MRRYKKMILAYSGGVDSVFLLKCAHEVLGQDVVAVTARSPLHPEREFKFAVQFAEALNVKHVVIETDELGIQAFVRNTADRCYLCKLNLFQGNREISHHLGIRQIAHGAKLDHLGELPTWDKPAMACLASRIQYGLPITRKKLKMVDQAETFILELGFKNCRVRYHETVARIEVASEDLGRIIAGPQRAMIVNGLRSIGFTHVALDLEGYVQGSMNRAL